MTTQDFVLNEKVDPGAILDLLGSRLLDCNLAERLAAYYRLARKGKGVVPVTYKRSETGRYYPDNGFPLYGIYQWRSVRASLFGDSEYDIDAVSCHPTIMCYLAEQFEIDCPYLSMYVKDREQFIDDLAITSDDVYHYNKTEHSDWSRKDMCKFVFTSTMFGSGIKKIIETLHLTRSPIRAHSICEKLIAEIRKISIELSKMECYDHLKVGVKDCHPGKIVSRIISNIESEIVLGLLKTFRLNKLDCTVYIYDGFQVKTQDEEFVDTLLEEFNEDNQYGLKFIRKPFSRKVEDIEADGKAAFARTQEEVDTLLENIDNPEVAKVSEMMNVLGDRRIHEDIRTITYSQERCKPFEEDAECNVIRSDLGSGKTYQVKAFIKSHQPGSAIFLTPRRIFAKAVKESFGDDWTLYLDHTDTRTLLDDFLICQVNSLYKCTRDYEHVYVDEIESCLEMLSASILTKKRRDVVEVVERIFRNAKRIVLCDADISMRTFDFLLGIGISPEKICFEHNTFVGRERDAIKVSNDQTLLWHFIDLIKAGKNVVFFSSSKAFLNKHILPIMQEELGLSEDEYLVYTPDTTKSQVILDVEKEWAGKRVIAYTPTITVGIDFNLPDYFDTVLVYAQNFGCGAVRSIFQAIHRVRNLRMPRIYYSLHAKPEPSHKYPFQDYDGAVAYVRDCAELRDFQEEGARAPEWFKQLHIWNMLEAALSKNKYEAVFDYYLKRYGYLKKTSTELKNLSKTTGEDAEDVSSDDGLVDFDKIRDIDLEEFLELDNLLRRGELDISQHREYYKHLFILEYSGISREFYPMMLSARGRHILKRLNWEMKRCDPSELLTKSLNNDYLETVSYDSILLNKIQDINGYLGLEYSADPKEIPLDRFSKPEVLKALKDVSKLLSLATAKTDVTSVGYLFRFWNGCTIEPVKAKGGKGIKTRTIDGKRVKLYQVVGLNGFKR